MSAIGTTIPALDAFAASDAALSEQRSRRTMRRLHHSLFKGAWKCALIDGGVTQHKFRKVMKDNPDGTEASAKLLMGVALIETAYKLHADIIAGRSIRLSVPTGFEAQSRALADLRRRVLWDALYHEAALACHLDGAAFLRLDRDASGLIISICDPEETFPVGPRGPDGQPDVWERRWIVERPDPSDRKRTLTYLRIERHRAIDGLGVVEQEAWTTRSSDVLQSTAGLEPATLDAALGPGHGVEPIMATGLPHPLIVELANYRMRGRPQATMNEADVGLVDGMVASFSRLARTMELHSTARVRVSERMVKDDGTIDLPEAIVDPDKWVEYIIASFEFDAMRQHFNTLLQWLIVRLSIASSLLGFKPDGGAAPDSYDKLRLEATLPMAYARRAAVLHQAALERLFDLASLRMAREPMQGWAVAPVEISIRADLPKDQITVAREQTEMRDRDATSEIRMLAEIHGDDQAAAVAQEIEQDRIAATRRSQASLFGAAFGDPPAGDGGEPSQPDAPQPEGAAA